MVDANLHRTSREFVPEARRTLATVLTFLLPKGCLIRTAQVGETFFAWAIMYVIALLDRRWLYKLPNLATYHILGLTFSEEKKGAVTAVGFLSYDRDIDSREKTTHAPQGFKVLEVHLNTVLYCQ